MKTEPLVMNAAEAKPESWFGMQIGQVLAERYRIERLVNRGGMGAVFEATQLGLDRSVAVKMLLPALSTDDKMRERFAREARSAAALSHPNITQIYDYGISQHGPYIVMEFVRGVSLRQLARERRLSLTQCVEMMEQICSAIASAHAAGIIHRDLKPDNVLVEEQADGQLLAKVLDFGIAKMRETEYDVTQPNLTGTNIIGSPIYMSPEQCQGEELDSRSDIYSLGILFYEVLTGAPPFNNLPPASILMHHVSTMPPPPSRVRPEINSALDAALMKALMKNREDRYETATEFAKALRAALETRIAIDTAEDGVPTVALEDGYATNLAASTSGANLSPITTGATGLMRRRLAILPLRNLSGDASLDYLGFALADSVITQLAPIKSLIVRPSSAVEKYRTQPADPRTISRELQVDTILSGSYVKAADMFRLNAQLIDGAQNEILWQEVIDLQFDNIIVLQDRVCEELIRGLKLNLSTTEQEALRRDEARNPLAYEFYLRGLSAGTSADEHKRAIEMLEASVGMEPNYAPAWSALAGRYINARAYLNDETMLEKAEGAARKALAINAELPSALFWLAVYHGEKGELQKAFSVCKELLRAAPNSEYAYQAMGHAYDYAGLAEVAYTLFKKAAEINPMTYPYLLGFIKYQQGELAEARREFDACPDATPEKHFWLAVIDVVEGDQASAIARLEALTAGEGQGLFFTQARALLAAFKGEREEGLRLLREALETNLQLGSYHAYIAAEIYAQLAEPEESLKMLMQAIRSGYGNYAFLMSDPLLAPVRQTSGFDAVAKAMQKLQAQLQLMLVTG